MTWIPITQACVLFLTVLKTKKKDRRPHNDAWASSSSVQSRHHSLRTLGLVIHSRISYLLLLIQCSIIKYTEHPSRLNEKAKLDCSLLARHLNAKSTRIVCSDSRGETGRQTQRLHHPFQAKKLVCFKRHPGRGRRVRKRTASAVAQDSESAQPR